jgi:hypothetical protein
MSLRQAEESVQGAMKIQLIPCAQIDANDYEKAGGAVAPSEGAS